MKTIRIFFGVSSLISAYAAALFGVVVVMAVGPYLAMGAQMYAGNTEPRHPYLEWPVVVTFVGLMLPVPFLYKKKWELAAIAAIPVALVPWWQLWRLYLEAGRG